LKSSEPQPTHPEPRFYGWRITWALALTQTVGYGVLYYAFSVLVKPMEGELGWTRAQTSLAFSLALLFEGFLAHPIGRWVDKHGARGLMTLGSILGSLCIAAWSQVTNLWLFYAVWVGIGVASAMVLYPVAFTVLAVWFKRLRSKAMLVVTLTAGLASTIFIPLCTFLVTAWGWRDALVILALLLALTTIPVHALVLRRHPKDLGLEPDGETKQPSNNSIKDISYHTATRSATFWWLSLAFSLSSLTTLAVAAHLVPLLLERGYTPQLAALAAGSVGVMQLAGRIFYTPLSERFSLFKVSAVFASLHALALCSLLVLPGMLGLWSFALLFGIANGSLSLAKAALVVEIYGATNYGSISGSMTALIAIATTFAPLGAGALHDISKSYNLVLWLLTGASLLAAVAITQAALNRNNLSGVGSKIDEVH
jgi:MFS family permease